MRRFFKPSTILAIVALVVAASGTAVAATKLANGDKLIKKGTLSGNRLRKHTLTGTQINVKKLGTVPKATNANHATSATSATSATTATSATNAVNASNASNAAELNGQPASSYLTTSNKIGTNGIAKSTGASAGTNVTLFKTGPFTITMTCTKTATGTTLDLFGSSTEAKSFITGTFVNNANTPTKLANANVGDPTPVPAGTAASADDVNIDFEAPSGAQAVLIGADGVNSLNTDCWANWVALH
ncbi:MAG TPA: hypothetical protein VN880_05875 [Solirubrobacteraceae bacterium]|nr:hypothetical protein [Solirubrobacteraceae bacterium]